MRDFINEKLTNNVTKSIYPYSEESIQELLSRFYTEIKNTNEISNKALTFLEWLVNEGVSEETEKILNEMYEDGRLADLINIDKYNELEVEINKKISVDNGINSQIGKKGVAYAGVIRNDGTGWKLIDDQAHNNINFTDVTNTDTVITVNGLNSKKIGSMVVVPDETLTSLGVTCGASVGTSVTLINCYAPFTGLITGDGTITTSPFFDNSYSVTKMEDNTGFKITYSGTQSLSEAPLISVIRDLYAPQNGLDIRVARPLVNEVDLRSYNDLYGYAYLDNETWNVATSCVADISASFSNGQLIINHSQIAGGIDYNLFQSVNVNVRDSNGLVHARIVSVNHTQITIQFYDNQGAKLTTPSSSMKVYFSRPGVKVPHIWSAGTRCYFNFGKTIINPNKLISGNGNLWLLGINQGY